MTGNSTPLPNTCQTAWCELAAAARLNASLEQIAHWRRFPGPGPGQTLSTSFLKHADDQTVAGLAAVCHAIHDTGLSLASLPDWGVVAAPRLLGRAMMVAAVQRFLAESAWGISPNLIPYRSLHAMSGTISQVLKAQGPNLGAGSAGEALMSAAGFLTSKSLPGVLVVVTALAPEPALGEGSTLPPGSHCMALALALIPATNQSRLRLGIRPSGSAQETSRRPQLPPLDIFSLTEAMDLALAEGPTPFHLIQPLEYGGQLELACAGPRHSLRWSPVPSISVVDGESNLQEAVR